MILCVFLFPRLASIGPSRHIPGAAFARRAVQADVLRTLRPRDVAVLAWAFAALRMHSQALARPAPPPPIPVGLPPS